MKKIAFVIRADWETKGGGDVDLARAYCRIIGSDLACIVSIDKITISEFRLIVLFNLDMPYENYLVARKCVDAGIPFVVYSLHPRLRDVENFLKNGTSGLQHVAARFCGYSMYRYETVACVARLMRRKELRKLSGFRTYLYSARFLLRNAAQIMVSCTEEADAISADFDVKFQFTVVRHLVDNPILNDRLNKSKMTNKIVCAGRIEPRKNQLLILDVAKRLPQYEFVIIGKFNVNHKKFVDKFQKQSLRSSNVIWQDYMPLPALQETIATALIYINLSWFEVFSLVDMMALSAGTPSVLSSGSYLADSVREKSADSSGIRIVNPTSVSGTESAILSLVDLEMPNVPPIADSSWSESVIRTHLLEVAASACVT